MMVRQQKSCYSPTSLQLNRRLANVLYIQFPLFGHKIRPSSFPMDFHQVKDYIVHSGAFSNIPPKKKDHKSLSN